MKVCHASRVDLCTRAWKGEDTCNGRVAACISMPFRSSLPPLLASQPVACSCDQFTCPKPQPQSTPGQVSPIHMWPQGHLRLLHRHPSLLGLQGFSSSCWHSSLLIFLLAAPADLVLQPCLSQSLHQSPRAPPSSGQSVVRTGENRTLDADLCNKICAPFGESLCYKAVMS